MAAGKDCRKAAKKADYSAVPRDRRMAEHWAERMAATTAALKAALRAGSRAASLAAGKDRTMAAKMAEH